MNSKSVDRVVAELGLGCELDALVAERVMGWEWRDVRLLGETNSLRVLVHPSYPNLNGRYNTLSLRPPLHPSYSTNIAAAWLVVERMIAQGLMPAVIRCFGSPEFGGDFWRCYVDESRTGFEDADTPALAICRAALAAVRTPHEED